MRKHELDVLAGETLSGRLARSSVEDDSTLFTYARDCANSAAVSISMPVRADQYDAMSGLLPIFEMNLPEGALRERLRNQFAKAIPEFDDLDMLAIVGTSQVGRLRYVLPDASLETMPAMSIDELLTYDGAEDLFTDLLAQYARFSGLSGVQPKVLVRDSTPLDRLTHRGATHIVKSFDSRELPELAANELICTRGATAAGIASVNARLSANRQLLIVDRFDVNADGSYRGVEDFCVLNGLRAHSRYDGSYEGIALRIKGFVSPNHIREAHEQFVRMVMYACATENGDAHLKNFAVVYDDAASDVSLAPAFDLVSTTPYIARDTLALTHGGTKAFPNRSELLQFARSVTGAPAAHCVRMLDQVASGVNAAIAEARTYARDHADAGEFTQRLIRCLQRGLDRSASLRAAV